MYRDTNKIPKRRRVGGLLGQYCCSSEGRHLAQLGQFFFWPEAGPEQHSRSPGGGSSEDSVKVTRMRQEEAQTDTRI
jgi:hypothetical protein